MDGFDRLIEMLEERFGRWFANALLVIVCSGAAALGLNLFVSDLIIPIFKIGVKISQYIEGSNRPITPDDLMHALVGGGISLLFCAVCSWLGILIFRVWVERTEKRMREMAKKLDSAADKATAEVERIFAPYYKFIREARAAGVEVPSELLNHEDEYLSSQLPRSTEESIKP
jgi:hypothetical protein